MFRSRRSISASLEFWEWDDDRRDGAFATLRRESPITFFEVADFAGFAGGAGHWALTTYDDVRHASRHPDIFSSSPTSTSLNDVPVEISEFFGSMITLDDPAAPAPADDREPRVHAEGRGPHRGQRARSCTTAGHEHDCLTPRWQRRFRHRGGRAASIADHLRHDGDPEEDEEKVFHWTTALMSVGDEEVSGDFDEIVKISTELAEYGVALAEERRARPTR